MISGELNNLEMIIAVDFDGTIVEHRYPSIGKEVPFALDALKAIQKAGNRIILWTFRSGKELDEAIVFCRERGLEFYAVNKNYPEEEFNDTISRKICADLYIDDRNLGGLPGWGEIYRMICPDNINDNQPSFLAKRKKLNWLF